MNDVPLCFDGVWKKFRRGERTGSLRDAAPKLMKRLLRRPTRDAGQLERDEFYSLRDVSFEVPRGQCLGIIGPNGAGKSTLLKCASRILRPNRGEVRVKGRVSALIEVGAGFHPDLTGRENVFLNGSILGMARREIQDRFDAIVSFAGMEAFIDTPVKRYSSGMFARLGFAVAAFMDPDVLLIDEVLSVGDLSFARKCEQKIRSILDTDTTVIFISHNLSAVRTICDRVLLFNAGQIEFDGDAQSAIAKHHELLCSSENTGQGHPSVGRVPIELTDHLGQPTACVETGQSLSLNIELIAQQPIEQATVGFFIRDDEDTTLYAADMVQLHCPPTDLQPGQSLQACFRFTANLLPGNYWVGTTIHGRPVGDGAIRRLLDHRPSRLQLTVGGPKEATGTTNLFAQCDTDTDRTASNAESRTGAAPVMLEGSTGF